MNRDFMRLLAQRLEAVPWVDVRLAGCAFPTSFGGVDGFFMGLGPDEIRWHVGCILIPGMATRVDRGLGGAADS